MGQEYTIKEALIELQISKATFYYRVNKFKQKIDNHIFIKNGKRYISIEGIEILKTNDSLDCSEDSLNSLDNSLDSSNNEQNTINSETLKILKGEFEFLRNQILEKDNQIQTLSRLVENSQLLLKQEQLDTLLFYITKKNVVFSILCYIKVYQPET